MCLSKVKSDKVTLRTGPLTVAWINDNYNRYQHFMESAGQKYCIRNKSVAIQVGCIKRFNLKDNTDHREYQLIVFKEFDTLGKDFSWGHFDYSYDMREFFEEVVTWEEASSLCRLLGGHLPWFGSRESLNEILALLKLSQDIPTVEAIYIGLQFHQNKVSPDCFCKWVILCLSCVLCLNIVSGQDINVTITISSSVKLTHG